MKKFLVENGDSLVVLGVGLCLLSYAKHLDSKRAKVNCKNNTKLLRYFRLKSIDEEGGQV